MDRREVLQRLADGKISVDQAIELLDAVHDNSAGPKEQDAGHVDEISCPKCGHAEDPEEAHKLGIRCPGCGHRYPNPRHKKRALSQSMRRTSILAQVMGIAVGSIVGAFVGALNPELVSASWAGETYRGALAGVIIGGGGGWLLGYMIAHFN